MKRHLHYNNLNKLFLFLGIALFSISTYAQTSPINESFENIGPYGGYQTETWTGDDGGTWTATDARTDQTINSKAITIQDGVLTSPSVSGGIGSLTVTTQRQFSGGTGNLDVVVNGNTVGTVPYDETVQTTTVSAINVAGNVTVELQNNSDPGDRIAIDDLSWTAYNATGNTSPSITNVMQTPVDGNVTSSDAVSVYADVTDSDGIGMVTLSWGLSPGDYPNDINMSLDSGNTYVVDTPIPTKPDGTMVYYEVSATDNNATSASSTSSEMNYTVEDPMPTNTIMIQDFDGSTPDWAYTSDVPFFDNTYGGDGFYGIIDIANAPPLDNADFSSNILAENDLDDEGDNGTSGFANITFTNVDISNHSNVQLSFDYQIMGYNANNDDAKYEVFFDGTGQGEVFLVDGGNDPEDASGTVMVSVPDEVNSVSLVVSIRDNGNSGYSGFDNFRVDEAVGNTGPIIDNITQTPTADNVTSSDPVSVSADITDGDGIASANLNWGTMSGDLTNSIAMSAGSGDTYTTNTDIPAQADGTTVYYQITATDDNNTNPAATVSDEQSYTVNDPAAPGAIIITEIMQNPSAVGDADGEYFEVYNNSNSPIDMNGWNISDEGSNSDDISSSLIVPAHGFATIGTNSDPATNGGIVVDYTISGSLSNGSDEIIIKDAGGNEVDRVEYDGGPNWPDPSGASMYFTGTANQDNNDGSLWAVSTESIAIGGDLGSPKFAGEGQVGQSNTYTYESGSWSPMDPNGNATADDDIQVVSGSTPANFSQDIDVRGIAVVSGASLDVENVLAINGDIVTYGTMTFKSTMASDGELAAVPTASKIIGEVTAERYSSDNRAFRFVSSPVTTPASIHANWQEAATSATDNPNPGFGTHITGTTTDQMNGFDATASGNPSLFTLDVQAQDFAPVDNTDVNTLTAGKGYFIFIRGDRSIDLTSNSSHSSTVLRATGSLAKGDKTKDFGNVDGGNFVPVPNPYQSAVDINSVITNSTNINDNFAYVYDPTIGSNGGYVTVMLPSGTNDSGGSSDANQYIQPGQAVQVAVSSTAQTEIAFAESDKAPGHHTTTFSNEDPFVDNAHINAHLFTTANYANGGPLHDSFNILFNSGFDNALNNRDAVKPMNFTENMGIGTPDQAYSVERRQLPVKDENIALFNTHYENEDYTLVLDVSDFDDVNVYLEDNFTGEETELQAGESVYQFSVDPNVEASVASNRFSIHFGNSTLSTGDFNTDAIHIYPNPVGSGQAFNLTTVNLNGQQVGVSLQDVLGKTIYTTKRKFDGKTVLINSGNLQSGVYFVNLKYNGNQITKRLIVK